MNNITMKSARLDEGDIIEVYKNSRGEVFVRYNGDATPDKVKKCFEEHRAEIIETIERWVQSAPFCRK